MSITTLDGALAGMTQPQPLFKVGIAVKAAGTLHSHWYSTGLPGAGVAPSSGVNGAAESATLSGQIPFTNPGSGNTYLSRLSLTSSVAATFLICDRLWTNSGLSVTATTSQSITSATLPARDMDGSTNGRGVLAGLEVSSTMGAGTPVHTLTYTNSAGTGSRSATFTQLTTGVVGTFYIWRLDAGDVGVRSIQSFQANATSTSGAFHIVLFRILAQIECPVANVANSIDALTSGFPRLFDSTVPFIIQIPTATTATNVTGTWGVTQG